MAKIAPSADTKIYRIKKWLGVNENPDGATRLKLGELSESRNWRITLGGSLQIRPGTRTVLDFAGPVRGLWRGRVDDREVTVCAAEGKFWEIDLASSAKTEMGTLTDAPTCFFGYEKKLYMLNGSEYKVWDGQGAATDVEGYRPIVSISNTPAGGGAMFEQVNKLTGAKRAKFSPTGSATLYTLPEKDIQSVDYAKNLVTDVTYATNQYSVNLVNGTVTFTSAPASGINTIEIGWTSKKNDRESLCAMRFYEIYGGTTDSRVFLYGDGSNKAFYSGLDENGRPTAEYFPDLNVLSAGEANSPITGLIRHFSRMLVFKENSAYSVTSDTATLADNSVIPAFKLMTINRAVGNDAPGQCVLVDNNPRSLHAGAAYEWKSVVSFLTTDERHGKLLTDRVNETLKSFDLGKTVAFDDERNREYYIAYNGDAVIHNYDDDAWYIYKNFPACSFLSVDGELYIGCTGGQIRHVSRTYMNDDGFPIDAYCISGEMAFDRDWKRKYSSVIWVAMKPERHGRVYVTAMSNRKADYPEKIVAYGFASFIPCDFARFSFGTNRRSQVKRVKLKVKKYTYYQLIFESNDAKAAATVVGVDFHVRYAGDVK